MRASCGAFVQVRFTTLTTARRPGMSADFNECHYLSPCRKVDLLAGLERHVSLLPVIAAAHEAAEAFFLALDVGNLHRTTSIFRSLVLTSARPPPDLRFGRVGRYAKRILVVLLADERALLGHHRGEQHLHQRSGFLVLVAALLISAAPRIWPLRSWSAARWHGGSGSPDRQCASRTMLTLGRCAPKAADSHPRCR